MQVGKVHTSECHFDSSSPNLSLHHTVKFNTTNFHCLCSRWPRMIASPLEAGYWLCYYVQDVWNILQAEDPVHSILYVICLRHWGKNQHFSFRTLDFHKRVQHNARCSWRYLDKRVEVVVEGFVLRIHELQAEFLLLHDVAAMFWNKFVHAFIYINCLYESKLFAFVSHQE